jgi:putative hemolysin
MIEIFAILGLAIVLLLGALLAAGGSAIKNSHPAQLERLEHEGRAGARLTRRVAGQASRLLLSLRVGRSLFRLLAIGLGLGTYFSIVAGAGGVSFLGWSSVLLGTWVLAATIDFLAESLAQREPLSIAIRLAPLVAAFVAIFSPIVWVLMKFPTALTLSQGERPRPLVTEEEILTLVEAGEEGGVIEQDERQMIYSIFQLGETLAREVMIPRIDILALDEKTSMVEATDTLLRTGYSRAPVYTGSIDNVTGIIYVKDLLAAWRRGEPQKAIAELRREAYFVPEAKKADDLLTEMQARHVQMAIVVDEYGGTAGLVTLEDIVEEIVGEIRDEYDTAEEMPYHELGHGEYLFRGRVDLDDLNLIMGSKLPKESSETLGGFIYGKLGRVPMIGEVVESGGLRLVVDQVAGRRIRKVRVSRVQPAEEEVKDDGGETGRAAEK